MKAVMYHYVRPYDASLPFFSHLDIGDFRRQLDYFSEHYRFLSRELLVKSLESSEPVDNSVILTFDDGFKDHYKYVLPELIQRNILGIFYISTSPYQTEKLLDVHRIHLLIGKYGGKTIFDSLKDIMSNHMLSDQHIKEFRTETYKAQNSNEFVKHVKRTLNYYVSYEYRTRIIDSLMEKFFPDEKALIREFYVSEDEIKKLSDAGMIIGSHTENHFCMSKLALTEQAKEIENSFHFLQKIIGNFEVKTFCYPYGGFHSFTRETEDLLTKNNCDFSFNVEPRDISREYLLGRRQSLPRFDCNSFPYGECRNK